MSLPRNKRNQHTVPGLPHLGWWSFDHCGFIHLYFVSSIKLNRFLSCSVSDETSLHIPLSIAVKRFSRRSVVKWYCNYSSESWDSVDFVNSLKIVSFYSPLNISKLSACCNCETAACKGRRELCLLVYTIVHYLSFVAQTWHTFLGLYVLTYWNSLKCLHPYGLLSEVAIFLQRSNLSWNLRRLCIVFRIAKVKTQVPCWLNDITENTNENHDKFPIHLSRELSN